MQHWQIKNCQSSPADKTAPALQVKELRGAVCAALFNRSLTYWWNTLIAPLWSPPLLLARSPRERPSCLWAPSYRAARPTVRNWTRGLFLNGVWSPPPQPPPCLQERLWHHLGSFPHRLVESGFRITLAKRFNWFTPNSFSLLLNEPLLGSASEPPQPDSWLSPHSKQTSIHWRCAIARPAQKQTLEDPQCHEETVSWPFDQSGF